MDVKKFKYAKQPDGLYTIYNVPFFKIFNDQEGEHGSVSIQDAKKILQNFQKGVKIGTYPRVFIGHHNAPGVDNRPGMGFLDNIRLENGTFFSDIVEVPSDRIKEMKERRAYPYRSVEYNSDLFEITGLAMLDSRKPFFQFPLLFLEDNESKLKTFQVSGYKIRKFQFQEKKKGKSMDDEKKEKFPPEDVENTEETDKMIEGGGSDNLNQCQFKYQELSDGVSGKLDRIMAGISSLAEAFQTLLEHEEEEQEGGETDETVGEVPEEIEPPEEPEPKNQSGKTPGSVSMQFQINHLKNKFQELQRENQNLRKRQDKSRVSQFSDSFAPAKFTDNVFLKKFQGNPAILDASTKALNAYRDTVKRGLPDSVKKFQETWGKTPEKFVNFMAEMEEASPGYVDKELK